MILTKILLHKVNFLKDRLNTHINISKLASNKFGCFSPFIQDVIQPKNIVRTDDWSEYSTLSGCGFSDMVVNTSELKSVHLVAALLKRWLLDTYQGAVRPFHLSYYLDEFTFRFNRRTSTSRGKLFYRLVQQAMMIDPAPGYSLKGPVLPFLIGQDNLNLDPLDEDLDHYM